MYTPSLRRYYSCTAVEEKQRGCYKKEGDRDMKHNGYYYLMLLACAHLGICYAAERQELTKVFFHEGALRDRIVLQFSARPTLQELPAKPGQKTAPGMRTIAFFIPYNTELSPEARGMITAVNRIKKPYYTIAITAVKRPADGLEVVVTYKPEATGFSYGTFDSITTQKCITFDFDDKQKLDALEKKSKPLQSMAALRKPKIVLDFGHGGSDAGKIASNGVQEKDVAAQVGSKVKVLLQQKGYDVMLTRADDMFVALDQRTSLANKAHADLFVSLHANAARKPDVAGLETYWAGQHLVTPCSIGDARFTAYAVKRDRASNDLATTVHDTILQQVRPTYALLDRKVRASAAQVLFATDMPSILIELGYLSNLYEAQMLARASYQNLLAQGISKGIDTFYTRYVQA